MKLANLQTAMLEAVIRAETSDDRFTPLILPARGISSATRLNAYRSNIRETHLQALDNAYPVTREVLGPRYWRRLLVQEIPAFGSRSPDLHQYGDFLPELISQVQKQRKELTQFDYLGELAQLEWQVHQTQFEAPDPQFDWVAFQALGPDHRARIHFTLSHALHRMRFSQPVDALWHTHQESPQHLPPRSPVTCCVFRQKPFDVGVVRLSDSEQQLLAALDAGQCLETLPADDFQTTTQTLHDWIGRGWITGFRENRAAPHAHEHRGKAR